MQETFPKAIAVRTKEVDGQVLIHDEINRNIHVLNHTAAAVLQLCDGEHSIPQIAQTFASDPDISIDQIEADIRGLIAQFQELGLLMPSANPA